MAADTPASSLDAAPKTPTTGRRQRSMLRKNSATAVADGQMEPPVTPSRRSTRTAAIRATGLIHDAVEEITGSRRKATPARKADYNSGQSSGDDAVPKTPTRRTREPPVSLLSPTTRRATRSTSAERGPEGSSEIPPSLATPRKRAAASRKLATSETEEDAANTLALLAATPRKRSTRGNAADGGESAEAAVKTPARRGRSSKTTTDVADELGEAAEAIKIPTRRGRGRQAKAQMEEEAAADDEASADVETESLAATTAKTSQSGSAALPPPHPDLAGVAKKLASMAVELEVRDSSEILSTTQSVDGDEFRTAPESPEKAASQATVAVPVKEDDGEISDLSDVEDPHFTKIMTAAAESATISAAESLAGSDIEAEAEAEPTSFKRTLGAASNGKSATHIAFDSDVEMDSEPEQIAAPAQKPADSDSDDDEAPEVVVTSRAKAGSESQPKQQTGASESDVDSVVPDAKSSKKRRPRHRKRPVSVTAARHAAAALENMAQLSRRPGHVLPSEIPEELRMDLDSELAAHAAASAAQGAKATKAGDRLDLAVLEQFASESKKRSGEDTGAKRSKKRKHKKRQGDESSRVVSGIRVVATEQPTTKTGLLENLAQSVPPKVRRFAKEERSGGRRIKRCDPLVAIARRSHHAAINFFKPSSDATL
ncbi:hypothetical protein IWW37_000144 [Coemansia sp. RSA 2050]|nr:hypothetical protein IWW37_000144 [Coemansia sp. RSA 2050]KAJ2735694.1 hypothetical protein IW152_001332 [Coemansia sp. BCRC 34962]